MISHKKSSSKKSFIKKKRVNILLTFDNKRFSFKVTKEINAAIMNVFITFAFKIFSLRFIMKSR